MQLTTAGTLNGKAGTTTAVTYTIMGDRKASGVDSYEVLGQGQLPTSTGALLTTSPVAASTQLLISQILLTNATASPVTGIVLYINGTAAANQIVTISLVANGSATYKTGQWQTYDAGGATLGGAGIVTSVTTADGSITIAGTAPNPTVSRAALTGDVTASAGSNTTTLATGNAGNLNSGTLLAARMPALTGDITTSAGAVATTLATVNTVTPGTYGTATAVPTITVNGKGLTTASSSTNIQSAGAAQSGFLSATNYNNINNYFGRILYNVEDYGVLPGNSAATNVTNLNTLLQTTAVDGAIIQFGPYTYSFNAGLTVLAKDFVIQGVRGMTTIAVTAAMGAGVPFIKMWNTGFYTAIKDLNFVLFTAAQVGNYFIMCQNNANPEITDCFFTGAVNYAGIIDFTGSSSGTGGIIKNLYMSNFTGIAINVTSALDTLYISDLEILGLNSATNVGISCDNGGAMLLSDCQIINCGINLLLAPTNGLTVSAIYASNCFFDQGVVNCLKITGSGTGTVARCHFVGCWFTVGPSGTSPTCILINSSGTGLASGIEFQCSWIMNANPGSTGTLTGILATAAQDITINNCQMAGWTTAIDLTPPTTAGALTPLIIGNNIGPAGLIPLNGTGIALRAGAPTAYGAVNICDNMLQGNTTPMIDASTQALGTQKIINSNTGLMTNPRFIVTATAGINTTETYPATAIALPANGLLVGTSFRLTLIGTCTTSAANISTFTVRVGTTGTTPASDTTATAAMATVAAGATGTASPFTATITGTVRTIGASTVIQCSLLVNNAPAVAGQGITGLLYNNGVQVATGAYNSNTNLFLNVSYKAAAITTTCTFQIAGWEILQQ